MEEKVCTRCVEVKPISEFYEHKGCKGGYTTICKACNRKYAKEWRRNNPERTKEYNKRYERIHGKKYREKYGKQYSENTGRYHARKQLRAIKAMGGQCQNQECNWKPSTLLEYGILQFHHKNGNPTKESLTNVIKNINKGQTDEYMLLCANCHIVQNYIDGTKGVRVAHLSEEEFREILSE